MKHDELFSDFNSTLENILKEGARKLLQQAIENEIDEYLAQHQERDERHHMIVKRNGYLPERQLLTGIGPIKIQKPRIRGTSFNSCILPRYMRRVPSIDALIPALYLKGISTGNMEDALKAILGSNVIGLSSTNIMRLKESWEKDYELWTKRSLEEKNYVYFWVDGIYFNIRLSDDRPCLLVIIGALPDGTKELVAIHDGNRESKLSWKEVLQDLKARGMKGSPFLSIGDGALGFWAAVEEEFPECKHQKCWVHKTANVLDKMAKSVQTSAKSLIHEMYMAPTKEKGIQSFNRFISLYEAKYPKACECLKKDKERLFTFYDFPAMHWQHIRTTNPIESTFATVRHRTNQTKGCGSRKATLSMVFQLSREAEKRWRKLRGYELIQKIISGVVFKDGEEVQRVA
jgi:putative transposase